jgi:hypothetical protein
MSRVPAPGPLPLVFPSLLQNDGVTQLCAEQLRVFEVFSIHGEIVISKSGVKFLKPSFRNLSAVVKPGYPNLKRDEPRLCLQQKCRP